MYCPSCGAPNPENASWCAQCGAALRAAPAFDAPPPTPVYAAPVVVNIKSHTGLAVFSLLCGLCCCFPGLIAAIVALVSAFSVNSRLAANNIAGAQDASRRASFWAWFAILCGIVGLIAQIILGILYGSALIDQLNHMN